MSLLIELFSPTFDAFFSPNLPFAYRCRLLIFQPISLLTYFINSVPCFLSHRTTTIYIPTRSGPKRCLIWRPRASPRSTPASPLPPLHLSIHGGAFIGGDPSSDYRFNSHLSNHTGCIVVSPTYRLAPRYPFPAAIDDIDDIVMYLKTHASTHPSILANPALFTISGSSAGGNLALAASQAEGCHGSSPTAFKACVTFYAAIDLRLAPGEKPKGVGVPEKDPSRILFLLFDSYARLGRKMDDPRCSPITAEVRKLPEKMLVVVPTVDILVKEQLDFVERVKRDIEKGDGRKGLGDGREREIKAMVMEGCFHGWLELPDFILKRNEKWSKGRAEVFDASARYIGDAHRRGEWHWRAHRQLGDNQAEKPGKD